MIFILSHQQARQRAIEAVRDAPEGYVVRVTPKTRSLESNALMWVLLGELSAQVTWHGQKLSAEEWKDMATAALKNQKVVPGMRVNPRCDRLCVLHQAERKAYTEHCKPEFSDVPRIDAF